VGWFIERWTTIKAAVGDKRHAVDGIVAAVIAVLEWAARSFEWWPLSTTPQWFVWLFIAAALLVVWLLNYATKLRTQISINRVALSVLRKEGVSLRNMARPPISDKAIWESWEKDVVDWHQRVIAAIREVSVADSIWFATLDVVDPPRVLPFVNDPAKGGSEPWEADRVRLYSWHDARLKRLDEMIQRSRGAWSA